MAQIRLYGLSKLNLYRAVKKIFAGSLLMLLLVSCKPLKYKNFPLRRCNGLVVSVSSLDYIIRVVRVRVSGYLLYLWVDSTCAVSCLYSRC